MILTKKTPPFTIKKLLQKLTNLKNTTSSNLQIGHKKSKTTTTKNKQWGQFVEVDAGITKTNQT
ncbi:MAG: hypothetical protein HC932_02890 [Thermales bacterium]|nr:hypothetical protein [Thermales bacterium]